MITYRQFFLRFLLVVLLLPTAGCDMSVDPVIGTEKAFSLYGVLMPRRDTQSVRVYPIEGKLQPVEPEPLEAVFTSTNLQTGQTVTWRDSLIQESDGQRVHVYWAPFAAAYDHRYRLEVTGPAYGTSSVTVKVPAEADPIQLPARVGPAHVVLPVLVKGVPRVRSVKVVYYIKYDQTCGKCTLADVSTTIALPYEAKKVEQGWRINIVLDEAYKELERRVQGLRMFDRDYGIYLIETIIHMAIVNKEWYPPGGIFNREELVQPGVLSNVENGFGFVGAGYPESKTLRVHPDVAAAAGFREI